jgi:UPF0755 protein
VNLEIPAGTSTRDIVERLEQAGLIRNATVFWYALKVQNEGAQFKAGDYALQIGMSRNELIERLNKGESASGDSQKLTIPEGTTTKQLLAKLETKLGLDRQRFLSAADEIVAQARSESSNARYPWLAQIPNNAELIHPLEGYLFPDTYAFQVGVSEQQVIETLLAQTDKKLKQLPSDWQQQLNKLGLTVHQMFIIASIIEREVIVPEERPIVAGVLYNRLQKNMPMQSCATVQYLLPNQKKRLLYADLEIQSPYNTYLNSGFPPGPIANPGLAAMKAALYPAETPYLFFVTRNDGSSGHYFAKTYAEHNQNISRSRAYTN